MKESWEIYWKDYFSILQIHPLAEPEVVKAAYDRLAHKYHPDKNPSVTSERMKDLNEAFEIISNPEKRGRYHEAYRQRVTPKPNVTPSPPTPQPPQPKAPPNVKQKNSRRYDNKGLGNLHQKGKYSNDTATIKNDNRVVLIIFIVIGVFAVVAPWYKYLASFSILWLVISILLSIIFIPASTLWMLELAKQMKLYHHKKENSTNK